MEEAVTPAIVMTGAIYDQNIAIVVHIAGIEKFVVVIARLSPTSHIWPDVVQVTKATGEHNMGRVV